jgi:hypothetical protein
VFGGARRIHGHDKGARPRGAGAMQEFAAGGVAGEDRLAALGALLAQPAAEGGESLTVYPNRTA